MSDTRIKVLVVEDAPTVRALLVHAIESDPRLYVTGTAGSGEEALEWLAHRRPDVILMDIHLPGMNGFEATRRIMHTHPVPLVICTGVADPDDVATTFEAMEAGALSVLAKPSGPGNPQHEASARHLVDTLRLMSEIKVVRRWSRRSAPSARAPVPSATVEPAKGKARMVVIGTSTGGPPVLRTILADLGSNFPIPILVVQHIARGFLPGLVDWLAQGCKLKIHIATHRERPLAGHVYFAPDGFHLGLGEEGHLALAHRRPGDVLCPSVGHLFQSVADVYRADVIAVLLTGMGRDGAQELAQLRQLGAITIAQDKTTSVVHGMPGEAIRLGGATYVLPTSEVAGALIRILNPS